VVATDPELLELCAIDGRRPNVVLGVEVVEAFVHCAKAFRRSGLWDIETWPSPSEAPSTACMLAAHVGADDPDGSLTAAALEEAYATTLWHQG
jgi:hypothetical protein